MHELLHTMGFSDSDVFGGLAGIGKVSADNIKAGNTDAVSQALQKDCF